MHKVTAAGVDIPALGFGTWRLKDAECERMERLVRAAALVGCARGALRAALDYAQEREQFGQRQGQDGQHS